MGSLVLLGGGSGSGKSTVAFALARKFPDKVCVLHLDDYFKPVDQLPQEVDGTRNWDHPGAIRFEELRHDVATLLAGQVVKVFTKSPLYHPGYDPALKNRVWVTVEPREVVLLEGFLALYDPWLCSKSSLSIYLEADLQVALGRRSTDRVAASDSYIKSCLEPGHLRYVVPTLQKADAVLGSKADVPGQTISKAEALLAELFNRESP